METPIDNFVGLTATQTILLRALQMCKNNGEDLKVSEVKSYLDIFPQEDPESFTDSLFQIVAGLK